MVKKSSQEQVKRIFAGQSTEDIDIAKIVDNILVYRSPKEIYHCVELCALYDKCKRSEVLRVL